jgi:hypothetical protein
MQPIEADYLIVGAGAAGMAFADTLLTESNATIALVDRYHRPGGHWNDAYPFVRLHQPSATYGVNSRELGNGRIDTHGLNKGFAELATGAEVVSYFDAVMRERFLPSGRVQYLPMSTYDDGAVTSLLSGEKRAVQARKIVDATQSKTTVPSRRPPQYEIAHGVTCVPVNELPRVVRPSAEYVIIGAGKTAIDACCWLLENGANPDAIRWIVPRDSWLLNRANFQPGRAFFPSLARSVANQVEALSLAESVSDLFVRLEACGELRRIDPNVTPSAYHCAIVSDGELEQLRRIKNVVRLGRVVAIEREKIVLQRGVIATNASVLHIDCSSPGIPPNPPQPVFQGDRIVLQWVRWCAPTFSAAFIGHIEAAYDDEAQKNRLCTPVPTPQEPIDWLRMMVADFSNRYRWSKEAQLDDWRASARLDGFTAQLRDLGPEDSEAMSHLQRYAATVGIAAAKASQLLSETV